MSRSVMIDHCVRNYGVLIDGVRVPVAGTGNQLLLLQAKSARTAPEKWLKSQIEALPTIARLAKEGALSVYSYQELTFEAWRGKSFPRISFGDVFKDVEIPEVPSAVERGVFFQQETSSHISNESQISCCKLLLGEFSEKLISIPKIRQQLTEKQIYNLLNLDRFRAICRPLSEKQYPDAFHLWTAEVNGISNFLTTDGRFIRPLRQARGLDLICKPIFPIELLEELGVEVTDLLPFEYGRRYYLNGVPYD